MKKTKGNLPTGNSPGMATDDWEGGGEERTKSAKLARKQNRPLYHITSFKRRENAWAGQECDSKLNFFAELQSAIFDKEITVSEVARIPFQRFSDRTNWIKGIARQSTLNVDFP